MKVLHLFDLYLPSTMNWAYQIMRATPATKWVAAPWIVLNQYYTPDFQFFTRPLQVRTGWLPATEWQSEWAHNLVSRSEHYWPVYRNWLTKQLRKQRPDVLHAHFGPVGCHYLKMAQQLDIPLVTSFYGYDYESLPLQKPIFRQRYQELFAGAAAITAAGVFGKKVLSDQGCPPEKIHISPMSMDPTAFPWTARIKQSGQLRLVQVATITAKKGYLDTLEAVRLAVKTCPNVHLTLAGEPWQPGLVQQMRAFIATHRLEAQITWLDFLPHAQLATFLGDFDVFIHPSHYTANRDCEGGPVAILEAQSSGLPVISTTHFDIPAEVLHERTGLLAPEHRPDVLAGFIERFYWMENDEYQRFSRQASEHITANFDVRTIGERMYKVYNSIINTR